MEVGERKIMWVYTAVWYGETENQTVRYQSKMMCEIATAM